MALPNPGMDAVPFTPLTAEFLDDMIENIESLSDGTGFENGAITTNTLAESAVTASKWINPYRFSVHLASNQSGLADSTYTKVLFDTKKFDTNNNFASNKYTAPVAGFYQVNSYVQMLSVNNNGFFGQIYLYKNGVPIQMGAATYPQSTGAQLYASGNISHLVQLAVGDTLEIYAWFDVGSGTTTITGGAINTTFSGFLVSKI